MRLFRTIQWEQKYMSLAPRYLHTPSLNGTSVSVSAFGCYCIAVFNNQFVSILGVNFLWIVYKVHVEIQSMKVRRCSRKCFPTDTSQTKKEWTHLSNYLLSSWRFMLLRQWFKHCLNLHCTQMICVFIHKLFSIGKRCGFFTACLVMVLRSSFSEGFSASALFNQIINDSRWRLGIKFIREERALTRRVIERPDFNTPNQMHRFSNRQVWWGLGDTVKTEKSDHKGFSSPTFIPLALGYLI